MTVTRRFFRYFALAVAAARIVAFAGAPVLEGAPAVAQASVGLGTEGGAPDRSVPFHDPSTCVVCQIISSVATLPEPATILVPMDEAPGVVSVVVDLPRQHLRRQGVLSRAPPSLPA